MHVKIARSGIIFLCLLAAICIFIDLPAEPVAAATSEKLFYSVNSGVYDIRSICTDATGDTRVYLPPTPPGAPPGLDEIAVDSIQGKVYFWDPAQDAIYQSDLDGTNRIVWLATSVNVYALSAYNGKVYYALGEGNWDFVWRSAAGGAATIIDSFPGTTWVELSAIDPVGGYLYYYEWDTAGPEKLYRTTLAAPQPDETAALVYSLANTITMMQAYNSYIYFVLANDGAAEYQYYVMRMDFDGTDMIKVFYPPTGAVKAIAVEPTENKFYMFENVVNKLYKTNLGFAGEIHVGDCVEFMTGTDLIALEAYTPPPAPEMSVSGNAMPIADGAAVPSLANHTDFGHVNVASGTVVRTFTVNNTGNAALNLTGTPRITIAGVHSADFEVTANASASIAAGGSSTFQITFNPGASGVRSANISIANDDSDENPYKFNIQGTGTEAPAISNLNGDAVTFTEGDSAVLLDTGVAATATDSDGLGWDSGNVTVSISGGGTANEDFGVDGINVTSGTDGIIAAGETISVGVTPIGTVHATYHGQNGASLVINLNAAANDALMTTLLRNITYNNDSQDPTGSRTVNFTVKDTYDTSAISAVTVNLVGVNDPPTLIATAQNPTFTEGGAAADLYSAVTISTIEAGQNITQLVFNINVYDGAGEIMRIDGSDVALTHGNSVVGTATNGMTVNVSLVGSNATVTIIKAGGISTGNMQTLVDGMTYSNTSENPNTTPRNVKLASMKDTGGTLNGGIDTTALSITSTVTITTVNDRPVVNYLNGDSVDVVAAGGAVFIDLGSNVTVSDVDSVVFDGGNLTIVQTSGTANGNFSVDGTNVTSGGDATINPGEQIRVGGVIIGTVQLEDGQNGHNLRINFTTGDATPARVVTLIRNILYAAPSGLGARTFQLAVCDGDGTTNGGQDTSIAATFTINVTPNPPVITNLNGDAILYNPFVGGTAIFDVGDNAAVTDPDSANFSGGNITITISAGEVPTEDRLGISTGGTITLSSGLNVGSIVSVSGSSIGTVSSNGKDGNDLVVTFSSNATPARVNTLLRALTYENTNNINPSLTQRSIQVTISDAAAGPNAATSAISTVMVNLLSPEINIQWGSVNIADGGTFNFGNHYLTTNTDITFTIQNTGGLGLTLTVPIVVGGANANQFGIQQQPVSPIAAGGTTTFIIRFTPTTEGVKTANISIANNDGNENPYDITINGSGILPPPVIATPPEDIIYITGGEGETYIEANFEVDANGQVQHTYHISSADDVLNITIPDGTAILDDNGNPVNTMMVNIVSNPPPPPPGVNIIGPVFNLGPDELNFTSPIVITLKYKHEDIRPGVAETDLKIGFYNEATGEWLMLGCIVDPVTDEITAYLTHCSYYAIILGTPPDASAPPPSETEPATMPMITTTPVQSPVAPTAPGAPDTLPGESGTGEMARWWLILIIAAGLILVLIIWRMTRRTR